MDKAVEEFGTGRVEVIWHPYIIDAGTNPEGEEYMAYNRRRWGSDGWTGSLRRMGATVGAPFANWRWWPATLKAHCLVHFAKSKGVSTSDAKDALFDALYEQGSNVSGPKVLAQLAADRLGLDRDEVLQYLESGAGAAEVLREIEEGQARYRVRGVPHFVVSGAGYPPGFSFSGAHPPEEFVGYFQKVDAGDREA